MARLIQYLFNIHSNTRPVCKRPGGSMIYDLAESPELNGKFENQD